MNLLTFETRVGSEIGLDPANNASEKTLIDGWVNDAVEQFLAETGARRSTKTFNTVASQGDYDLLTVASDLLDLKDVTVTDSSGNPILLDPRSRHDILLGRQYVSVSDTPRYYELDGATTLRLYPSPTSVLTVTLYYVPKPASLLAAPGDDPATASLGGIPTMWHPVLEAYAKWRAASWDDDTSSQVGQAYKQEWEQGVVKAKARLNKMKGRLAPARPGRRRRFPVKPGIDVRF